MVTILKLAGILIFFSLLVYSCERVITLDIKEAPPRYVVEGVLNDDSTCWVRLSETKDFYEPLNTDGLSNAVITIAEEGGNVVTLRETTVKGFYRARFTGRPGHSYHLKVAYQGNTFTASSTMPQKVRIDSLYVTQRVVLGKQRLISTIRFQDPPALGNAYRFVQFVDGDEETTIFVTKDDLINGRSVTEELLIFNEEYTLRKCDQLRVVLQSIELPVYRFWYSLSQNSLGFSQSGSPGNPASTIEGGAIGYFSAHTVSERNIAVFPDSTCSYPASKKTKALQQQP